VFALDLDTGTQRWMVQASQNDVYTINNPRSPDSDFGTNPILFEAKIDGTVRKLVGLGQKSGVFWAFDRTDGKIVWKRDFGSPSSVGGILNNGAYDGEHIIVASNGASSTAPGGDPSNGKTPAIFQVAPVATVFALDPSSGDIVWENQVGAYVWAPITLANGVGFVAVEDELQAFDTKTGAKLPFSFDAGGTITSAPVIVDGRVFFGSGMTLVVFGKPDPDNKFHVLSL
jgi:polyvinyl alcohol dehydrogenase (cytochrome)